MKRAMLIAFIGFVLNLAFSTPPPTVITSTTGLKLLNNCAPAVQYMDGKGVSVTLYPEISACLYYVLGSIDQIQNTLSLGLPPAAYACYQQHYQDLSYQQTIRVVYNFLTSHPALLNNSASSLVLAAFTQAFPVPNSCRS